MADASKEFEGDAAARASGSTRGFVEGILSNLGATERLFAAGDPARVLGLVCGSEAARGFWQRRLDVARESLRAEHAIAFHEDLPVNQAFGLLLLWRRLRERLEPGGGALVAFVFGEGSRATPITEAECGQKPAIRSFATIGRGSERRWLPVVELALRQFAPVEAYLRRSGFDGLVVKWGDEVQIPACDLSGSDARLAGADVVRFVSLRAMDDDDARNKDWVGIDDEGRVTRFLPRRPLAEMERLADRGILTRRDGRLVGGINLGSIAVSRLLLDLLLDEFDGEVMDPSADRKRRPDLDPQFFTALTIAAIERAEEREAAYREAMDEIPAIRSLEASLPGVLGRLRRVLDRLEERRGRAVSMRAMDFGEPYWGDVGQHGKMYALYHALAEESDAGRIARALAGVPEARDADGNRIAGRCELGPDVRVRDSVLVDARVGRGEVEGSVLVGTRCGSLRAHEAFDVGSVAVDLELGRRAGAYRLVAREPVCVAAGERVTTVFFEDRELRLRVREDTDLRDRSKTYDVAVCGNPVAFGAVHEEVVAADPDRVEALRADRCAEVERILGEEPGRN